MTPKTSKCFNWTPRLRAAASLIAVDEKSDDLIAAEVGIAPRTLQRWKKIGEFAAEVALLRQAAADEARQRILREGIADRVERVRRLNRRADLLEKVIEERALAEDMEGVAGGRTGLIVHTVKGVGKGDDFQLIDLYSVDVGMLKELRETERQVAQELGQWTEKAEISGPGGGAIPVGFAQALDRVYGDTPDEPSQSDPEAEPASA